MAPAVTTQLLPSLLFPAISAIAVYIVFGHVYQSGAAEALKAQCASPSASPYALRYTGIYTFDHELCGLVACFHALMAPSHLPFNVDLLSTMAPLTIFPAIESARQKRHPLLEIHVVMALIYQRVTAAVTVPWYWLMFITTGTASRSRGEGNKVDQAHAEAILFSLSVGFIIPSIGMLTMDNPWVTALWQVFPLWMFIAQHAYLSIRPRHPQSGYRTIQGTYIFLFLLSAIPHIYLLGPAIVAGDHAKLKALFVPSLTAPISSTTPAGVLDFIQWDLIFAAFSTFLVFFWIAENSLQFAVMTVWFVVAGVLFGMGSAFVGLFAWREGILNAGVGGEAEKAE